MKAYVFDLDGVICTGPNFTTMLEQEHGIAPSRWGTFFTDQFLECVVGRRDLKRELEILMPKLGWTGTVDELLDFWFTKESGTCGEALRCVRDLRLLGHPCYLGTNQERHRAEFVAETMAMRLAFNGIYASGHMGYGKPSVDYFKFVEASIGCTDILLVDDSLANVRGAEFCGWRAIHYHGPADIPRIMETATLPATRNLNQ